MTQIAVKPSTLTVGPRVRSAFVDAIAMSGNAV